MEAQTAGPWWLCGNAGVGRQAKGGKAPQGAEGARREGWGEGRGGGGSRQVVLISSVK